MQNLIQIQFTAWYNIIKTSNVLDIAESFYDLPCPNSTSKCPIKVDFPESTWPTTTRLSKSFELQNFTQNFIICSL